MVKKGSFILYTIDMVNKLSGYRVAWFITLTFGYAAGPDDIEIAIRKWQMYLARYLKGHLQFTIGYESGQNSHAHIVVWWKEFDPIILTKLALLTQSKKFSRQMWPHGIVDCQVYDEKQYGYKAVFYSLAHKGINDAGEVICGNSRRSSCRKGRCVERQKIRDINKALLIKSNETTLKQVSDLEV
jgi:hypothetical protein